MRNYTLFYKKLKYFVRNLYLDGQIAEKLSVLKPQRLRLLIFFFIFIVILKIQKIIMIKTCEEKHLSAVQTLIVK